MANKLTVTYNGSNIINGIEISGDAAVTYNGSTLATVTAGQTKTLNCLSKAMATNVVVGGKTLNCAGKLMASNVVVKLESLVGALKDTSWADISAISRAGQASQYWKVGDTKTVNYGGNPWTAQIVAFDQYDVANPSSYGRIKAGIVFQIVELSGDVYKWSAANGSVSGVNSLLPAYIECKDYIVQINRPHTATYNATSASVDQRYAFLPSEQEVCGTTRFESIAIGSHFAFYAAGNSAIKYNYGTTTANRYWTRSRMKSSSSTAVAIAVDGTATMASTSSISYPAGQLFCI